MAGGCMCFGAQPWLNAVGACCVGSRAERSLAQGGNGGWREHAHHLVQRCVVQRCSLLQSGLVLKPVLRCQHRETNQQQDAEEAHGRMGAAIGSRF